MEKLVDIRKIVNLVSLRDVVSEATEVKPETVEKIEQVAKVLTPSDFDFPQEPVAPEPHKAPAAPVYDDDEYEDEEEEEEEYDAEKNAKGLVYTLASIDSLLLNTVVVIKSRQSAGGSKAIKRMKAAYIKKASGQTLDESEQNRLVAFEKYKADMDLLSEKVMYKPKDLEKLIELATEYCQETKFKSGPAMAFWATYVGSLAERTTQILIS